MESLKLEYDEWLAMENAKAADKNNKELRFTTSGLEKFMCSVLSPSKRMKQVDTWHELYE